MTENKKKDYARVDNVAREETKDRETLDLTSLPLGPDELRGPHPYLKPKDAAALILLDFSGKEPHVFMGKRNDALKFMPGKYVFPGGRVDQADSQIQICENFSPNEMSLLLRKMKGRASQTRARALGLAALRETFEETGFLIGNEPKAYSNKQQASQKPCPALWQPFIEEGILPTLSPLRFVARAITPPGRIRRYDTRFFCIDARHIIRQIAKTDGEFSHMDWLSFDEAKQLDIPLITRIVLEEIQKLTLGRDRYPEAANIPYFYVEKGKFFRESLK